MTDRIPTSDEQPTVYDQYRDYRPHIEYNCFVWYKTTASTVSARNMKTGAEQRTGTRMNRVVTNAIDYETAKAHLDRYLDSAKPKVEPKVTAGPNQMNLDLDGE